MPTARSSRSPTLVHSLLSQLFEPAAPLTCFTGFPHTLIVSLPSTFILSIMRFTALLFPVVLLASMVAAAPLPHHNNHQGKPQGNNKANTPAKVNTPAKANPPAKANTQGGGDFHKGNGQEAQRLNVKFATLSENSACKSGEEACINGKFAQCANNVRLTTVFLPLSDTLTMLSQKFVTTACAQGTKCFALPLVLRPGTVVAYVILVGLQFYEYLTSRHNNRCTTQTDTNERIQTSLNT
jgi:hypothetical protein